MTLYKVWIHIEEINEPKDHCHDIDEPQEAGRFDSMQDARSFVDQLLLQSDPSSVRLHIAPPPNEDGLFRVVYIIDVNASDAKTAARETHETMIAPDSMAPVLHVLDPEGHKTTIDLSQD